jgi:hypothetical protein
VISPKNYPLRTRGPQKLKTQPNDGEATGKTNLIKVETQRKFRNAN